MLLSPGNKSSDTFNFYLQKSIARWEPSLGDLCGVGTKLKEIMFKNNKISFSLLQLEHGFCQQNGPERGQVQDSYPNEKWWWFPFV